MGMVDLSSRLENTEELLKLQARQLQELEAARAKDKLPDYGPQLDEIRQLLQRQPPAATVAQLEAFQATVAALPRSLPVEHHHHFEKGTKGLVLGGVLLFVLTALALGSSFSLYRENSRLQGHDVQYRLIRLHHAEITHWADSVYHAHPEDTRLLVERQEARLLAIAQAEKLARHKEAEAREAARKVSRLKKEAK